MKILERIMDAGLQHVETKGTDVQKADMAGVVAQTARSAGELDDRFSGTRDPHTHTVITR